MSSGWTDRLRRTLGFRLALWYSGLFVVSSLVVTILTYALLIASLQQRDRDLIRDTLARFASEYDRGGLAQLNRVIASDARAGRHERLFVRVLARGSEAVFFTMPADWGDFDLDRLQTPGLLGEQAWAELPGRGRAVLEVASVRLREKVDKGFDRKLIHTLRGMGYVLRVD